MTDISIKLPDWPGYAVTMQGRVLGKSGGALIPDKAGRVSLFKGKLAHSVYPAELLAETLTARIVELTADTDRLKLENGKLKKLVAARERQRDALAAKLLNVKSQPEGRGRKAQAKPKKRGDEDL